MVLPVILIVALATLITLEVVVGASNVAGLAFRGAIVEVLPLGGFLIEETVSWVSH